MNTLSSFETYCLFGFFAVFMMGLVWIKNRHQANTLDSFLLANRNVSVWKGAFSIAVSWIWAPAIFICSLQAYTKGLPGIFWFTAPNILCFFVFAAVATKLREKCPDGYSLPDYIWEKYGENPYIHGSFLFIAFGYQLSALIINAVAGGTLLHLASGISIEVAIIGTLGVALAYSLIGGFKASVLTDILQISMILIFAFILVPWAIFVSGGAQTISDGFAGVTGEFGNIFDPWMAYALGIPMTVSLIAGPISDQMFYQRAMAVKKESIKQVFARGGLIFGAVPIILSLLGFIGVTLSNTQGLAIEDPQMVSPIVIGTLLPKFALYLFILMAFAGLCSTMDSAFCGISVLGTIDVFKKYRKMSLDNPIKVARCFMIMSALIAGGIALLQPKLIWVFFIYGALASAGFIPTLASLFWDHITGKDIFLATILSLVLATPLSVYANITENPHLIVISSVTGIIISLLVCGLSYLCNRFEKPSHNIA